MRLEALITALALPAGCRVDQRVPKKMLVDNGAPTSADKRLLTEAIEEMQWVAALKPGTVAVPEFRDDAREYLEIAVLTAQLRASHCKPAQVQRLAELVHRAIPYPVLLLLQLPGHVAITAAHKRSAQNEVGKVVLDGDLNQANVPDNAADVTPFLQSLAMGRQPQLNLLALYQGWMDCLTAWQAAQLTGHFSANDTPAQAAARREALRICKRLEAEATQLRGLAAKERQMAKQVELNLALQRLSAELALAREQL